jgi:hypothetical protein
MTTKKNVLWPVLLIVVFALSRWPGLMPANFSATYALVFCAGLYLSGPLGWIVPLVVLLGSDLLLSLFFYKGSYGPFTLSGFLLGQAPNYLGYAGLFVLGRSLGPKRSWWMSLGGGIIGALWFYIVTNTAAWMSLAPYQKTLAGWIQAITTGLPGYPQTWTFFRNTILSGGLFTGLFVAAMKLTEAEPAEEKEKEKEASHEPEAKPAEAES